MSNNNPIDNFDLEYERAFPVVIVQDDIIELGPLVVEQRDPVGPGQAGPQPVGLAPPALPEGVAPPAPPPPVPDLAQMRDWNMSPWTLDPIPETPPWCVIFQTLVGRVYAFERQRPLVEGNMIISVDGLVTYVPMFLTRPEADVGELVTTYSMFDYPPTTLIAQGLTHRELLDITEKITDSPYCTFGNDPQPQVYQGELRGVQRDAITLNPFRMRPTDVARIVRATRETPESRAHNNVADPDGALMAEVLEVARVGDPDRPLDGQDEEEGEEEEELHGFFAHNPTEKGNYKDDAASVMDMFDLDEPGEPVEIRAFYKALKPELDKLASFKGIYKSGAFALQILSDRLGITEDAADLAVYLPNKYLRELRAWGGYVSSKPTRQSLNQTFVRLLFHEEKTVAMKRPAQFAKHDTPVLSGKYRVVTIEQYWVDMGKLKEGMVLRRCVNRFVVNSTILKTVINSGCVLKDVEYVETALSRAFHLYCHESDYNMADIATNMLARLLVESELYRRRCLNLQGHPVFLSDTYRRQRPRSARPGPAYSLILYVLKWWAFFRSYGVLKCLCALMLLVCGVIKQLLAWPCTAIELTLYQSPLNWQNHTSASRNQGENNASRRDDESMWQRISDHISLELHQQFQTLRRTLTSWMPFTIASSSDPINPPARSSQNSRPSSPMSTYRNLARRNSTGTQASNPSSNSGNSLPQERLSSPPSLRNSVPPTSTIPPSRRSSNLKPIQSISILEAFIVALILTRLSSDLYIASSTSSFFPIQILLSTFLSLIEPLIWIIFLVKLLVMGIFLSPIILLMSVRMFGNCLTLFFCPLWIMYYHPCLAFLISFPLLNGTLWGLTGLIFGVSWCISCARLCPENSLRQHLTHFAMQLALDSWLTDLAQLWGH